MKSWRKLRTKLASLFPSDKLRYNIKNKQFEITGKRFIKEEFDMLSKFCDDHKLWFFLYSVGYDKLVIIIKGE